MASPSIALRYVVKNASDRWLLEAEDVPETPLHDAIIELLMLVLKHRYRTEGRPALVSSNLGCRWDPDNPRVGMDPDVVLVEPPPPQAETLSTLRIWEPGHASPRLAVEVVSESNAEKDYEDAPARAAHLGIDELWVFDPLLCGPTSTGGPFLLQVWRRTTGAELTTERVYAGDGPAYSEILDAWLIATDRGRRLRLAADREGQQLWLTEAEAASARATEASARAERESARADAAEAEVRRLQKMLQSRGRS